MSWEIIVTILGSLGGWEGIKYLINRKTYKRKEQAEADKADAEADGARFDVLSRTVEFLQTQLHEKEERFAEQTKRLREVQDREYRLIAENNQLKLDLATYRCVVPKCPNREPKNNY